MLIFCFGSSLRKPTKFTDAAIAQLGERQAEDLEVRSGPPLGAASFF